MSLAVQNLTEEKISPAQKEWDETTSTVNGVIVHYHEIALKLGNRAFFEKQLRRNILRATRGLGMKEVRRLSGRMMGILDVDADLPKVINALQRVFGIAYFAPVVKLTQDLQQIKSTVARVLNGKKFSTFKISTKRAQKHFPLTSPQINAEVGEYVRQRFPATVDLSHPDLTIYIEIVDNDALIYTDRIEGPGGLPVGTSERAVCLISGGIDSPVAAFKMMKRGVKLIFVHFHSAPFTSAASQRNVERLVEKLTAYQFHSKLYLVPFAEIQQHIVAKAASSYRVLLYRRAMIRLAEAIARQHKTQALVTGENVSQVASQTLTNLRVIDEAASFPILRPLAGDDKQDIIALARRIGTFEISTEPYEDCCSLFVPAHPQTRAKLPLIQQIEAQLDLPRLIEPALANAVEKNFRFPS